MLLSAIGLAVVSVAFGASIAAALFGAAAFWLIGHGPYGLRSRAREAPGK